MREFRSLITQGAPLEPDSIQPLPQVALGRPILREEVFRYGSVQRVMSLRNVVDPRQQVVARDGLDPVAIKKYLTIIR